MTVPNLLAAVCALDPAVPTHVTLVFDVAIASAGLAAGFSMRANGAPLTISSVAAGTSANVIVATLSGGPAYNVVLDASFDQSIGDWHNASDDVVTFLHTPVTNASKVGDPASNYPLSSVITDKLVASAGAIIGAVSVDLNAIDAALVKAYEPQLIDFGGTFGVTSDLPGGVVILQDRKPLTDGMLVKKTFLVVGHSDWAAIAAAEWEVAIRASIGNALANLRTIDAATTLGDRVIKQV